MCLIQKKGHEDHGSQFFKRPSLAADLNVSENA